MLGGLSAFKRRSIEINRPTGTCILQSEEAQVYPSPAFRQRGGNSLSNINASITHKASEHKASEARGHAALKPGILIAPEDDGYIGCRPRLHHGNGNPVEQTETDQNASDQK